MFFKPFKVLKKHWLLHILWFVFVPVLASLSLIISCLNGNNEQILNDLSLGYFYIVSISIICSFIYDIFVCIYENYADKHEEKFPLLKMISLIVFFILIIISFVCHLTAFGQKLWVQITLFVVTCFVSFYCRLVFKMDVYLDKDFEYLEKENDDIKKLNDSTNNVERAESPDGGSLKL